MPHDSSIALVLLLSSLYAGVTPQNNDVTYDDIVRLNAACPRMDNCKEGRHEDDMRFYNCQCRHQCDTFGTCCVDSKFRRPNRAREVSFECRTPYGSKKPVFMVDGCRRDEPVLDREKCLRGGNALEEHRFLVPVTSLTTGRTYRNFYCYTCNEYAESSSAVTWNLKLTSNTRIPQRQSLPDLHYDEVSGSWITSDSGDPVFVTMEPPAQVTPFLQSCRISVIDTCAESWTDRDTEAKCGAYTALVSSNATVTNSDTGYPKSHRESRYEGPTQEFIWKAMMKRYRNPHCALCNFEDPSKLSCINMDYASFGVPYSVFDKLPKLSFFVGLFSLEDKDHKCPQGMNWNNSSKKCRKVRCGRGMTLDRHTCLPNN